MRKTSQWDESRIQPQYAAWTVIGKSYGKRDKRKVPCRCECGRERDVLYVNLKLGRSVHCMSCGRKSSPRNVKHGQTRNKQWTPEYRAWKGMLTRCYNQSRPDFELYGARGITVCDEWRKSFAAFFEHVGNRPSDKHSLDRVNNNLGYQPGNVRWATHHEQANNRRKRRSKTKPEGAIS